MIIHNHNHNNVNNNDNNDNINNNNNNNNIKESISSTINKNYHNKFFNNKFLKIGLRTQIALKEATVVALASILIITIPLGLNNSSLILIPVFCVIVSCYISSFTILTSGAVVVYGSGIGSLYTYLLYLVTRDHIWVSFILNFLFCFVIYSLTPGRPWFTTLCIKKILLDHITIFYFTSHDEIYSQVLDNFIGSLFIFLSVLITSFLLFPTLATRLYYHKMGKTFETMRDFFKAVGYQLQVKLFNEDDSLKKNLSFNFPFYRNFSDNEESEEEDQYSYNNSDDININIENNNNEIIKNEIEIPIEIQSQSQSTTLSTLLSPIQDILKLPLARSSDIDTDPAVLVNEFKKSSSMPPPPPSLLSKSSLIPPPLQPLPLTTSSKLIPPPPASILKQYSEIVDGHQNQPTSSTQSESQQQKKSNIKKQKKKIRIKRRRRDIINSIFPFLYSSTNTIKRSSISTSASSSSYINTAEKEFQKIQTRITTQVNRLLLLLGECKQERWNSNLTQSYDQLLVLIETALKQLISLKHSCDGGFGRVISQEILTPMMPFLECIIEEVHLQIGVIMEILTTTENYEDEVEMITIVPPSSPTDQQQSPSIETLKTTKKSKKSILEMSFQETEELINKSSDFYKQIVLEIQKSEIPTLPAAEVSRVHFYIFGIFQFALQQKQVAELVYKIKKDYHQKDYIHMELMKHGLWYIFMSLPLYVWHRLLDIYHFIQSPREKTIQFFKQLWPYIWTTFFMNKRWHFPLQASIAIVSSIVALYYFEGRSYNQLVIKGVWTSCTVVLVMSPSIGASITRGFHRIVGTIIGGFAGYAISLLSSVIPTPAKQIVLIIFSFIWVTLGSFVQQDPRHTYAGAVTALTFLIVALGQYLSKDYSVMYAVMRSFHIVCGVVWVVIINVVVFPYFSYKATRVKLFTLVITMNNVFIKILKLGLKLDDNQIKKEDRETMKKEIQDSLRTILLLKNQVNQSLYDVKTELILHPNQSKKYFKILKRITDSLTCLISVDSTLDYEFSEELLSAIIPIKGSIIKIIDELDSITNDLNQLINNDQLKHKIKPDDLLECLTDLNDSFQNVRIDLFKKKIILNLYPAMIQFGSGIKIKLGNN
eukprot:gene4577-5714_t